MTVMHWAFVCMAIGQLALVWSIVLLTKRLEGIEAPLQLTITLTDETRDPAADARYLSEFLRKSSE